MPRERWAWVRGYKGLYRISTHGRIRSVDRYIPGNGWRNQKTRKIPGKMMTPLPNRGGYLHVTLSNNGVKKLFRLHTLVLTTFVGPCPPGMECRHYPDQDRKNNRLENLQWGTRGENNKDKRENGTNYFRKHSPKFIARIRKLSRRMRNVDISNKLGVSQQYVSNVIHNRIKG